MRIMIVGCANKIIRCRHPWAMDNRTLRQDLASCGDNDMQ